MVEWWRANKSGGEKKEKERAIENEGEKNRKGENERQRIR